MKLGLRGWFARPAQGVLQADPGELVCNHYKFKSKAEYAARAARLNHDGYMAGKFSRPVEETWERESNATERRDILRFVEPLKRRLAAPLAPSPFREPYLCAVVTMFRAEEDYIDEWLAYHLMQGVEHFFLYNNGDDLARYGRLHDYVAAGYVTLTDWPDSVLDRVPERLRQGGSRAAGNVSIQQLSFRHCQKVHGYRTRWLGGFDIDEYMVPVRAPDLATLLRRWHRHQGIVVPRLDFGSMGLTEKPDGLVIDSYRRSQAEPNNRKSIAQTRYLKKFQRGGPHTFEYVRG